MGGHANNNNIEDKKAIGANYCDRRAPGCEKELIASALNKGSLF